MKREHDDLEEKLRNLPKYSLTQEDKRKVIHSIRSAAKPNRLKFLKPLSVFVAAACLLMVAYLASPMYKSEITQESRLGLGSMEEQDFLKSFKLEIAGIKSSEVTMDSSKETLHGVRVKVFLKSKKLIPIDVWNSVEFRAANPHLFLKDGYGIGNSVSYSSTPSEDGYHYTVAFESLYANYSEVEIQKLLEASEEIKFTMEYQGKIYELNNKSQKTVTLDAPLAISFTLPDRDQNVIGLDGKIGILGPENFVAEDTRRVAKLMLYYWGNPESLVGKEYKVEAMNIYGETLLLSEGVLSAGLYSEDAHILTSFPAFTGEGEWQLSFYVEENLFEAFRIEVLPPLPKTENYILLDAPIEIPVGKTHELIIENRSGEEQSIEVQLMNSKGIIEQESIFQLDPNAPYDNQGTIYHYHGNITIPEKGEWSLVIDGEQTQLFEN